MKHVLSLFAVLGVLFMGCGGAAAASVPQPVPAADPQDAAVLLSSTVCAYPNCTDTTHFHHHAARHCRNRLSGYSAGWYRYSVPADTVQTASGIIVTLRKTSSIHFVGRTVQETGSSCIVVTGTSDRGS